MQTVLPGVYAAAAVVCMGYKKALCPRNGRRLSTVCDFQHVVLAPGVHAAAVVICM
jgi:hypothetical protein